SLVSPRVLHPCPTRRSSDLPHFGASAGASATARGQSPLTKSKGSDPNLGLLVAERADRIEVRRLRGRQDAEHDADERGEAERERSEEHTSELQSRENLVCRL